MSTFTQEVKEEICRNDYNEKQMQALLSAYLKNNITINIHKNNISWEFKTNFPLTARFIYNAISKMYNFQKNFTYSQKKISPKSRTYKIQFFGSFDEIEKDLSLFNPSTNLIKGDDNKKAFISGCFLSGGSINNPENSNYHLEIRFLNKDLFDEALSILQNDVAPNAKTLTRNKLKIIYIKKSEQISDFLKYVGATDSMFDYEQKRIYRDYSNQMHRLNNLDVHNFKKTIDASNNQINMIKKIKGDIKLYEQLSQKEKWYCNIRLENPDFSLNEICEKMESEYETRVTKSAINHYSRKIKKVAS